MSLYHYFDSRDELLELMADTVAEEMLVPDLSPDWRPALEAIARREPRPVPATTRGCWRRCTSSR